MSQHLYQAVIRALLEKGTWVGVRPFVGDAFVETTLKLLVAQIDSLHGRIGGRDLSVDDLRYAVEASHGGQLASDLLAYVEGVGKVSPAAEPLVREVLARELLAQAQQRIADASNRGILDLDGPAELVRRAQDVADGTAAAPAMTLADEDQVAVGQEMGTMVSLGLSKRLDRELGGGAGVGSMTVFHGPSKRGKTSILCKVAQMAVAGGQSVLYVDCENGAPKIMQLILRAQLRKRRSEWTDADAAAAREALVAAGGRLWIKDLSAYDVTPSSIEALVRGIERTEGKVDLLILDHLEHLSPDKGDRRGDEMRFVYGRVARQTRRMARRMKTRLVTAWQSNRDGVRADTLDELNVGESYDVFKHADTWITLNRSAAEEKNHLMRLGILKKRVLEKGAEIVRVYCDWGRMVIEDEVKGGKDAVHRSDGTTAVAGSTSTSSGSGVTRGAGVHIDQDDSQVPREERP